MISVVNLAGNEIKVAFLYRLIALRLIGLIFEAIDFPAKN